MSATLPADYQPAEEHLNDSLTYRSEQPDGAWSSYDIDGDDDSVTVQWQTNDDRDAGVPTEDAEDTYPVEAQGGLTAIERALQFAGGGSRHGVGHAVFVRVNGTLVVRVHLRVVP